MATSGKALIGQITYVWRYFSANVDFGTYFSGHYNRLALITLDIISGVYCIGFICGEDPLARNVRSA